METGILASISNPQNCVKPTNKIPDYAQNYAKEYLFIRGINNEFQYFINKLDDLNHGLFESRIAERIKYAIKRFLKAQECGRLKDISKLEFGYDDVENLIFIKDQFRMYKIRWDYFYDDDSDDDSDSDDDNVDVYPGFKDIYDVFELFYSKLKFNFKEEDNDFDFDIDYDSDRVIVLDDGDIDDF